MHTTESAKHLSATYCHMHSLKKHLSSLYCILLGTAIGGTAVWWGLGQKLDAFREITSQSIRLCYLQRQLLKVEFGEAMDPFEHTRGYYNYLYGYMADDFDKWEAHNKESLVRTEAIRMQLLTGKSQFDESHPLFDSFQTTLDTAQIQLARYASFIDHKVVEPHPDGRTKLEQLKWNETPDYGFPEKHVP